MKREYIENKILTCVQCGHEFIWYWREQLEMAQREERMNLTDPTAKLPAPKRCRVCRMRRWKERQQAGKFLEVKAKDDARIKEEIERERQRRLNLSGNMARVSCTHLVLVQEKVTVKIER
jgi:hypothetical protein